jgi:hypothetical protein
MKRGPVRTILRSVAAATVAAGLISGVLATYCASNVANFYAGAQRLDGTIVGISNLPGGSAPLVEFVDDSGLRHVQQFGPFYATPTDAVGDHRTVLYNSQQEPVRVIESPRNWIGSIVYGSTTISLLIFAGVLIGVTRKRVDPSHNTE